MWKQINESSNSDVKALLQQAIEIANPTLKGVLQKVIDKYLNIPKYDGYDLDTWQVQLKTLRGTLSDMGEDGDTDYDNQVEMINHIRSAKPDFMYWYYGSNENVDSDSIRDKLESDYPNYVVKNEVWWTDSTNTDCGFISMYKRRK